MLGAYVSISGEDSIDRRAFLTIGAIGATAILSACASPNKPLSTAPQVIPPSPPSPAALPLPLAQPTSLTAVTAEMQHSPRLPVPPGTLSELPGDGNLLAWTVDDGTSAAVIAAHIAFAKQSGTRFTFFLNGCYDAWDDNADALRPLVESGQIQLANHTWSHPDLTTLTDSEIVDELQRNHDYITNNWGVDARPYFRPPFGYHDARVDAAAASIGYTVPTLWYGTLGDSGGITEQQLVDLATEWFLPGRIVIGHLNYEPITHVFDKLEALIRERGLRTVTLNDVFSTDQHR